MHVLGEADIANPRVELQPLHDFEVHLLDHVPARHLSLSCRLNFRGFRMVFGVWTMAKYVPAHFCARKEVCRGDSARKPAKFRGKSAAFRAINLPGRECR